MNGTTSRAVYDEIAEIYDVAIPDPDGFVDYYRGVCTGADRVLYVGCGTGRLLSQLVPDVGTCVGVDPSAAMLERAQARVLSAGCEEVTLLQDAMPDLSSVDGLFDVILVAGGAFEYLLTTDEQLRALRRMRGLLGPQGQMHIDVAAPPHTTSDVEGNYRGELTEQRLTDVRVASSRVDLRYDHFMQVVDSTCSFVVGPGDRTVVNRYRSRYTTYSEWRMLPALAGLRAKVCGGFHGEPVTRRSSNYVISAVR